MTSRRPSEARRRVRSGVALPALVMPLLAFTSPVTAGSAVQPLAVTIPGAAADPAVLDRFAAECKRRGFLPVVPISVAGPPTPVAAAALETAVRQIGELHLAEAVEQLDVAAADAVLTGGAGLSAAQLADIYFYRAIARQKLSPTEPSLFWDDYVRAATLAAERVLDPGRFAPAAVNAWRRASAAVQRGPHGTLVVRAPVDARIVVDAHAPVRSPALLPALSYGEHLVRVEEPGRWPWAITVRLAAPSVELDVPIRAPLTLDDATAAAAAQRRGAAYALVAQPRVGGADQLLDLRLVETSTRLARAVSVVVTSSDGALESGVARVVAASGASDPAVTGSVPGVPASRRTTALLVVLGAAAGVAAGILVGSALHRGPSTSGFPAVVNLERTPP